MLQNMDEHDLKKSVLIDTFTRSLDTSRRTSHAKAGLNLKSSIASVNYNLKSSTV